eukprot:CAMPEP_0178985184 /NCGR_PEP_ID=MMETSP0795-20121207/2013_1 /TAXON_ID=88552 /ORGANISM="Amoebophrya sp., Strain Ameob2" /LENGTH=650 /DNA_ID=CAMNT_0020676117 /DNA_START=214 /DNA_END=2166 /DNA_ORIENTATION=+
MLKPLATFYGCALLQTCTPTAAFELDKKASKTRTKARTPNPITSDLASGLGRKLRTEAALLQKEDGARILKVVHFVDKHAPVRDRAQLSTSYKLENARLALAAYDRVVAKWGRSFYTGMNASTSEVASALLGTEIKTPEEGATSFLQEFEVAAQDAVVDEQLPFLFLNDVAPYAVFSERRTEWRQWFFESLTEAVFGGSNSNVTATELINLVNSDLVWNNSNTNRTSLNLCAKISPPQDLPHLSFSLLNTARSDRDPADDGNREATANTKKECSGPIVFIPSGYDGINNYDVFDFLNGTNTDGVTGSSCTGQAVFMVALFRTLGIPARAAGVPHWKKGAEECPLGDASEGCGNHNWVEVWDGSKWHFLSPQPQEQGTAKNKTGGTEDVAKEEEQGSGGTLLQLRGRLDSRRRTKEMKARSRRTRTHRADDEVEVEEQEGAGTLDQGWFFPEPVGQAVPSWIQENSSNVTGSNGSNMTTTNASNVSAMNATSTATSSGKGNHSVYATSWMNSTHFGLGVSSWAEIADMLHNGLTAQSNRTANETSSAAVEANSTEDESGLTFITTLFETTNTAEEYSEDASLEDDGGGLRTDVEGKPAGSAADVATDLGNDTFAHPTGFFPIVWADGDQEVSAWDVTCRYLPPEKQEEYAC